MSLIIPKTTIRSQGSGVPAHVAPASTLYFRTSTGKIYKQIDAPKGSNWRVEGGMGSSAFGETSIAQTQVKGMNREP